MDQRPAASQRAMPTLDTATTVTITAAKGDRPLGQSANQSSSPNDGTYQTEQQSYFKTTEPHRSPHSSSALEFPDQRAGLGSTVCTTTEYGPPLDGRSTAQCSTAFRSTVVLCIFSSTPQHSTAQRSTAQHSAAQHSAAQHSTAQHSTTQHSTAQHSTAYHNTTPHHTTPHLRTLHSSLHHSAPHNITPQGSLM